MHAWHIPQRKQVPAGHVQVPLLHTRPSAPHRVPSGDIVPPVQVSEPALHDHVAPVKHVRVHAVPGAAAHVVPHTACPAGH